MHRLSLHAPPVATCTACCYLHRMSHAPPVDACTSRHCLHSPSLPARPAAACTARHCLQRPSLPETPVTAYYARHCLHPPITACTRPSLPASSSLVHQYMPSPMAASRHLLCHTTAALYTAYFSKNRYCVLRLSVALNWNNSRGKLDLVGFVFMGKFVNLASSKSRLYLFTTTRIIINK